MSTKNLETMSTAELEKLRSDKSTSQTMIVLLLVFITRVFDMLEDRHPPVRNILFAAWIVSAVAMLAWMLYSHKVYRDCGTELSKRNQKEPESNDLQA